MRTTESNQENLRADASIKGHAESKEAQSSSRTISKLEQQVAASSLLPLPRPAVASALILVSAALFGTQPILAKVAYAYGVTPLTLVSLRTTFASLGFLLALLITRRIIPVSWRLLAPLLALGMTVVPFLVFSYYYALSVLPASSTSVIINSSPVHVAWMSWLLLGESLHPVDLGITVGIVGGTLLIAGQTPHTGHVLGLVALAIATLASAFYLVAQRRLVRDVHPVGVLSVVFLSSAVVYWGAGLATSQIRLPISLPAQFAVAGSTLVSSVGSLLVLSALRVTTATRTALLGMLEPVVAVILSVLLLDDLMTWLRAAGIAVVLSGIMVLHIRRVA